jgi:sulfite reductase alpha subunit-like flavoprotein
MENITIEQQIAVLQKYLPMLETLDGDQLKSHIEKNTLSDTVVGMITSELTPKINKAARDSVTGETAASIRKYLKEIDSTIDTESEEWKGSISNITKKAFEIAKKSASTNADTKNAELIRAELLAQLEKQYEPTKAELLQYKEKVTQYETAAEKQRRKGIVDGVIGTLPILKDAPTYKHFERLLSIELEQYDYEPMDGVGVLLKKDGELLKKGANLVTLQSVIEPLANEMGVIRKSDTPPAPNFTAPPPTNGTPKANNPNSYADAFNQ